MSYTPERLLNSRETAEYLGVHVKTLQSWHRAGRIRSKRIGSKALRFRMADINKFVEGRGK